MLHNPKQFFTTIAFIFGFLFVFILPPGHVPDEPNHFFKSYHISLGHWKGETKNQRLGGSLPVSLGQFFQPFRKMRYHYDEKVSTLDFQQVATIKLNPAETQFEDFPNTAIYTPIGYASQSLTIFFLRQMDAPPIVLFYLTRITSLLFWIGLVGLAISWIPFGKWTLTILALLPSSLWIHVGITADLMTNGVSFLLIALILKMIYGEQVIRRRDFILAIILASLLSITKIVYFPIFALVFLIPKEKFSTLSKLRPRITKTIYIGVGLVINLLIINNLYKSSKENFIAYEDYNPSYRSGQQINEGANPSQQFTYVVNHPIAFTKTMVVSYFESAKATLAHYFGKFGWEKNYLPSWIIGLLLLATIGVSISKRKKRLDIFDRIYTLGIAILMMIGFAIVIYIQWSPVGSDQVLNLAGRYMIPIFPLFFLAIPSLLSKYQPWILLFAQVIILVSLSWGAILIVGRYY